MKKNLTFIITAVVLFTIGSCTKLDETPSADAPKILSAKVPEALKGIHAGKSGNARVSSSDIKGLLNETLFQNSPYKIDAICMYTEAPQGGTTVETVDQQFVSTLSSRWVPGDVRRNWNGDGDLNDVDFAFVAPLATAPGFDGDINALPVYAAMLDKWEKGGYCKTVSIDAGLFDLSTGLNPSLILDFGLEPADPQADVQVVGFLPPDIFEDVLGSPNVLGVAFSFVFIGEDGEATSTTRGKDDKAYCEVWFNAGFPWSTTLNGVNLESVVLHEFGHALNLGHFGILQSFTTGDETTYVYQPVNTMNALYIGEYRNFLGPNDKGNYCEAWGSWPWN